MRSWYRNLPSLFLACILASPLFTTGCAVHARVYDPEYHQYHAWAGEQGYYNQWEQNTHRQHMDYNKRSDADKKAYWDWRHSQTNSH